jgi:hypothetical protein
MLLVAATSWAACTSDGKTTIHGTGGTGGDDTPTGGRGATGGRGGTGGKSDPTGGKGGDTGGTGGDTGGKGGDAGVPPSACAGSTMLLVCDPMMKMPKSIKDTGVYPAIPDLTKHFDRLILYSPEPALWSDGLAKERFMLLPEGAKVDNSDAKHWSFPPGTIFVKSFFADNHKIVETRFVRHNTDPDFPYEYYTYKWNAAGTDATMEGWMDGPTFDPRYALWDPDPVAITLGGKSHMHPIPGQTDCTACHEENRGGTDKKSAAFIGFDEIRLNNKLPGAQQTQLEALVAKGLLTKPPGAPTITGATEVETRVKRFLYGNCVHCHNDIDGNNGPMDLRPDTMVAAVKNIAIMGHVEAPPTFKRVVPGKPLLSVVYVQAARIADMINKQYSMGATQYHMRDMPPVGVTLAPTGANLPMGYPEGDPIKDLFDWITALK